MNNGAMNSNDSLKTEQLWSHLWWLVVLEQQGSFTAAAARLGVSKAAVSQHIAGLERAAGVPLVRRTTRSMLLTEAGQHLVQDTRDAFARIAGSFAQVRDLADAPRGRLRVTAPVALARQHLVPRLPGFLDKYPDIQLELDLSDQLRPLSQQGLDLAIRHIATPPENHVAWALCATHSVLVASQDYLDRHGAAPASPDELRQHRCLHYPRGQEAAAWTLQRAHHRAGTRPLGRQQQRGAARRGHCGPGHCPGARLQRPGRAGFRPVGAGAAAMAADGRLQRHHLRHAPLFGPCAARGGGFCRVGAGGVCRGVCAGLKGGRA